VGGCGHRPRWKGIPWPRAPRGPGGGYRTCCGSRPVRSTWPRSTPAPPPGSTAARRPARRPRPAAVSGRRAPKAGTPALAHLGDRLSDLQEKLHAEGVSGGSRRVLLVLQGMDTSGKGGVLRHVVGQVDPQGCEITSIKAPTAEELAHHFLWLIRREGPR